MGLLNKYEIHVHLVSGTKIQNYTIVLFKHGLYRVLSDECELVSVCHKY